MANSSLFRLPEGLQARLPAVRFGSAVICHQPRGRPLFPTPDGRCEGAPPGGAPPAAVHDFSDNRTAIQFGMPITHSDLHHGGAFSGKLEKPALFQPEPCCDGHTRPRCTTTVSCWHEKASPRKPIDRTEFHRDHHLGNIQKKEFS